MVLPQGLWLELGLFWDDGDWCRWGPLPDQGVLTLDRTGSDETCVGNPVVDYPSPPCHLFGPWVHPDTVLDSEFFNPRMDPVIQDRPCSSIGPTDCPKLSTST